MAGMGEGIGIAATPEALARILDERPALWVGAGASVAAGYPSTSVLEDAMVRRADDPIDRKGSFFEIADAFVASMGEGALADLLQEVLGPPRPPAALHRHLARLARTGV